MPDQWRSTLGRVVGTEPSAVRGVVPEAPGFEERVLAVLRERHTQPVPRAFMLLSLFLVGEDRRLLLDLEQCPGPVETVVVSDAVSRVRCTECPIHDEPGVVPPEGPCRISHLAFAVQDFRDAVEADLDRRR